MFCAVCTVRLRLLSPCGASAGGSVEEYELSLPSVYDVVTAVFMPIVTAVLMPTVCTVRLRLLSPCGASASVEEYELSLPSVYARSILTVPWVELGDKVTISCEQTGFTAAIIFHTKVTSLHCFDYV